MATLMIVRKREVSNVDCNSGKKEIKGGVQEIFAAIEKIQTLHNPPHSNPATSCCQTTSSSHTPPPSISSCFPPISQP